MLIFIKIDISKSSLIKAYRQKAGGAHSPRRHAARAAPHNKDNGTSAGALWCAVISLFTWGSQKRLFFLHTFSGY
jgi:hypothetical protein